MRNLSTLLLFCLTASLTTLTAQIQQFISSNDFPAVETYEAKVCIDSPVTLYIVDDQSSDDDWTWYGPNGFSASGKVVYISAIAEQQLGLFEAVSSQGAFYHFELMKQNDDFVNWKNDRVIVAGSQVKIKSPVIKEGYTYEWSNGAHGSEINVSLVQTTSYSVTVTTAFGCSDDADITVHVAKAKEYLKNRALKVCKEGMYYLDGPRDFEKYEWLTTGANTEDLLIQPSQYGSLLLRASDLKGDYTFYKYRLIKFDCNATEEESFAAVEPTISDELNRIEDEILEASDSDVIESATENIDEKRNLEMRGNTIQYKDIPTTIYPNPASDFITVDIDQEETLKNVEITILDSSQNRIYNEMAKTRDQKIDLRTFRTGIYYLVIRSDKGRTTQQFIVAR